MNSTDGLKNSGLKATIPRLKILDMFQRAKQTHMSAEAVFRLLILENFDIGLATVYRVLTQFEQAGLLTSTQFEGGQVL